jgi:transposase
MGFATFPPEAAAPVQYGPRIRGAAIYLKDYQLLPFGRLTETMCDLFACDSFSEGTLANLGAQCSRQLAPVDEIIREKAAAADVAGFDETGVRATGSPHLLHTVATQWLPWYFAHPKRGTAAMDAAGVLPDFKGRAVHDFWESYPRCDCAHAFCNAHLPRELVFLWEEQNQAWAKSMIDHLLAIRAAVDTARQAAATALPQADRECSQTRCFQIVAEGYAQNPAPEPAILTHRRGRRKQSKARHPLDRFREHPDGILAFMYDFTVPFDNSLSERDLRMMKLREKISGTSRSPDALVGFCRIRSHVSTARKNGLKALQALQRAFAGSPFLPVVPVQT